MWPLPAPSGHCSLPCHQLNVSCCFGGGGCVLVAGSSRSCIHPPALPLLHSTASATAVMPAAAGLGGLPPPAALPASTSAPPGIRGGCRLEEAASTTPLAPPHGTASPQAVACGLAGAAPAVLLPPRGLLQWWGTGGSCQPTRWPL